MTDPVPGAAAIHPNNPLFIVSTATASPVTPALREALLTVVNSMPSSPGILVQLGNIVLDPASDLSGIADMLKRDAALTARLIRIANSAAYNTGEPYASLEAALARVGMKEVYRMAGIAAVAHLADQRLAHYGITGGQLRENALLGALVTEALAERIGLDSRAAYTAGLLRSTGKIALDRMTHHVRPEADLLEDWERATFGISNCDAAAVVLQTWRFPEEIVGAIRDHYHPDASSGPLCMVLNLAGWAVERGGHALPGESGHWEPAAARISALGLEPGDIDDVLLEAMEKFAEVHAAVK